MRAINALGAFDLVPFGASANLDRAASAAGRVASIRMTSDAEQKEDGSPDRILRTVRWELTIKTQATTDDPKDAYAELDLLTAVVHNATESKAFGGFAIPWKTRGVRGRVDDSRFPELRYVLTGSFSYVVDLTIGGLSVAV